jgi:hypothetical protein
MAASVGLQVAAMFPLYPGSPPAPIAQVPYELAASICLAVGWMTAATMVLSGRLARAAIALGAGLGAVQVGLVATDLATGFQIGEGGDPGVWLALAGLAAGLAGVLYGAGTPELSSSAALHTSQQAGPSSPTSSLDAAAKTSRAPGTWRAVAPLRASLSVLVAVVAVAAFWPSWDHYHVVSLTGQVSDLSLGNAFDQPAAVMAGELVAGLAIGFTVIVGALWPDAVAGAFAIVGAAIGLASQVVSGAVQVSEPLSQLLGATATNGVNLAASSVSLTGYWYVDLAATAALGLLALWQLVGARKAQSPPQRSSWGAEGDWPQIGSWPPGS